MIFESDNYTEFSNHLQTILENGCKVKEIVSKVSLDDKNKKSYNYRMVYLDEKDIKNNSGN